MFNRVKAQVLLPLMFSLLVCTGVSAQTPTPAATVPPVQGQFVANKKPGKPFHKLTCSSVKTMKGANLVYFANREDAIQAKHHSCKICKP